MLPKELRKQLPWWKHVLFFLLTPADEALVKYDGAAQVPQNLQEKWAIEIEQAKVDIYIERMRKRTSVSYWLQWIFPVACVILAAVEVWYAHTHSLNIIKDTNLFLWITTGLGGAAGVNVARKVSKHAHLKRINGSNNATNPIPEPEGRGPGTTPVEPEVLTEDETEDDGGFELPPDERT